MGDIGLLAQDLREAVMAANAGLDHRFVQAMNNKDIEGVMGCCLDGPDLVFILYGNILRGSEAVRGFVTNMFAGARSIHLEIDEIKRWCFGETVFAVGIATYEIVAMDGTKSRLKECWTDARRSVAGKWVYVLNHATEIPG